MKKFFHYILMAALIGGVIPFISCSDDDETINEWNLSYISLLPVDYLKRKHSDKCTFYTLRFDCSFAAANTIKPQLL